MPFATDARVGQDDLERPDYRRGRLRKPRDKQARPSNASSSVAGSGTAVMRNWTAPVFYL